MTSGERNWSSTTGAILMVSLMLFSTWIQIIDNEATLEEAPVTRFLTASDTLASDTQTNSSQPNTNYGSAQNLLVGDYPIFTNARILANFPLTLNDGGVLPSTAIVSEATLELTCRKISQLGSGDTALYPARLLTDFDESNATHNLSDTGIPWNVTGVEGVGIDRGQWEPGTDLIEVSNVEVFSLNLTSLVQEALRNGESNMSIVISGVGNPVYCTSSEGASGHAPALDFEYTLGSAPSQGGVVIAGPEDGDIIADQSELTIMPDYSPTISWDNLSSSHIEIQFSNGADFRSALDDSLIWNSWDDSSDFSMTNGEFACTPTCSGLQNGTWVYFRIRSVNNSILGQWESGYFGLPAEIGSINAQGQAEILLRKDTVNLGFGTVHDTWVMDGNTSYNGNDDYRMRIGHSNDSTEGNMHAFIRVNMETVPIHDNVTIHDATLNLRRTDRTGEPMISAWLMDSSTGHVFSELDYANSRNGVTWTNGGQDQIIENSILGTVNGNQSGTSTLTFDATSYVQAYLHDGHVGDLDFLIMAEGLAGEEIEIATGDEPFSYRPHLDITYSWGDSVATSQIDIESPATGSAAWDLNSWELESTLTPTITWDSSVVSQSNGNPGDVILQLFPDGIGNSIPFTVDSRVDGGFDLSNGEYTIPSSWGLDWAHSYEYRMLMVDDDEQGEWDFTSLLVSEINSTSLGGGEYELRYRHGNATSQTSLTLPYCGDLTLESGAASGMNLDGQDLTASSSQVILVGCDLSNHVMPDGLAIISATMRLRTLQNSGISSFDIPMTMYESSEHDWDESTATWNTTDGSTPWNGLGASGSERVQSLDTTDIDADSTWYEWNVTAAVQSAMRTDSLVDFILASESSANWNPVSFYDRGSGSMPELVIVYTNGSNAAPNVPIDMSPANGDWILSGDYTFAVDQTPTLDWNETGSPAANAWQVQIDGDNSFSTSALLTFSSWIDTSSFSGTSFTFANDLNAGEEFYWRARGISATGQIGLWSAGTSFVIPDLEVSQMGPDRYEVTMGHGDILSDGSMPLFTDTWISWASSSLNDTHGDEDTLFISGSSSALIEIPIDGAGALPHPSNARLVDATISFQVLTNNSSTPSIAIYETLQDWDSSATGLTYDGTTNWSALGGTGVQDRSAWIDVAVDQPASTRMALDITEIIQAAIVRGDDSVGLMLSVEANSNDRIVLASTETQFDANEPELSLTWQNGTATAPTQAATILSPANGDVLWDYPAMSSDDNPGASWSHPAPSGLTAWRIYSYPTSDGPWDGVVVIDSRTCSTCTFDMTNLTMVDTNSQFGHDDEYSWMIQPIQDGMFGPRSTVENFIVPNDIGDSVNSTDYWVDLTNGNAYSAGNLYDVVEGAYLESCNANTAYGNTASYLNVGASNGGPACTGQESRSLLRFDISNVPIMDSNPWQVVEAHVELYRLAGSSNFNTNVSASSVHCNWGESSVTWNDCATNNSWQSPGAYGANDADMPAVMTNVSGNGWYSWNVTQLMQQARMSGSDTLSLLFASEDSNLYARHAFIHEDATGIYEAFRPVITVTYRAGTQSMPSAPSWDSVLTANGPFTAWDSSSLRPAPLDPLSAPWTHASASSIDSWQIQYAKNDRFTLDSFIYDSSDSSTWGSATFDLANLTMFESASTAQGDHWNHLRIRAVQNGVYSNWSDPFQNRVPDEQGSDDGAGNYTVTMQRGVVFEDTGILPSMPDSWIQSNTLGQYNNHGSDTTLAVGLDPEDTAHEAVSLVSIDLAEYPYPATMLPTSVTLRMYVASISGSGAHSIAIHDCSGFNENNVSWNNYNPSTQCNSTAASSMTSTSTTSGVWYEWDVTGIARSAWASTGVMNMALQTSWAGTVYFSSAEGSNAYAPELEVGYVDNPNNASSPAQVTLVSPEHLEVVYDVGQYTLGVETRPRLTWDSLGDATGYILILSNESVTQTYKSWDSNSNSGFTIGTGTPPTPSFWEPSFDLAVGEIYTWSVQALNASVPGPRSVPSTFGIGNPDITDVGNHVHTVAVQEGSDVPDLGHLPVWDTYLNEGDVDAGHGTESVVHVGTGCESIAVNRCHAVYQIDMGQMPLDQMAVNPHSAQLSIYADQISQWSLANYLDLTAYAVINPNFDENSATWNSASSGFNWSTAGMQSGVDYVATPLDTVRVMSSFVGGWLHFDVSGAMTTMNGTVTVVIMGTVNTGHMLLDFKSSESVSSDKPKLEFNYTSVDSISLSGPSTTDADSSVQFSGSLLDATGNSLPGDVLWSCTDGTIDASGHFTPDQTGIVTISAAYGQVIESVNITVTAGSPIQLVVVPLAITLTADDVFTLSQIMVIDANGNVVPGETINLEISNGTLSTGMTLTTPVTTDVTWTPWTAGQQYLNATWSFQPTISIPITVNVGAPAYFEIIGDSSIEAGNTTGFTVDVFDQRGNQMDSSLSGVLTWGAENGLMDNATGSFTGDQIGTWNVWVDSDLGIHSDHTMEVTYGDIADLEVTAVGPTNTIIVTSSPTLDSISMTADDEVTFDVVRIDVQGNRENIDLPISGWTWLNGQVNAGSPTTWDAANQGSSWVKATLEGFDVIIPMAVDHGLPVSIEARAPSDNFNLTSGQDTGTLSAFASDADGNEWSVSATWTTDDSAASDWLTPQGTSAIFEAVLVGDWTVNVLYVFNVPGVGDQSVFSDATFTVTAGSLNSISVSDDTTITADDTFDLNPDARDVHGNDLPETPIQWLQWDSTTENAPGTCSATVSGWTDISIAMRDANYIWDATTVGEYTICAAGENNVQSMSIVTVTVGEVANVWHKAYSTFDESGELIIQSQTRITAGEFPIVEIWVADADGNQYQTPSVSWSSVTDGFTQDDIADANSNPLVEIGNYRFDGSINQVYTLTYSAGSCATCSGTWNVTVDYGNLHRLEAIASSPGTVSGTELTIDQQATVTIDVEGFDQFGNPVPVQVTDLFDDVQGSLNLVQSDSFTETSASVYMLNEGVNTLTICADGSVSGVNVCDQVQISVEGTLSGFFEANAPWSWIGLSAVIALLLGVVLVVVVLMRRGNIDDDYDDDFYDDEEYDAPEPAPVEESPAEPVVEEEYSADEDPNYRVDEDGTEWWEDDEGVWWYRDPDMDDWAEWTE